eukprot:662473-Amphidinium_carterae.2
MLVLLLAASATDTRLLRAMLSVSSLCARYCHDLRVRAWQVDQTSWGHTVYQASSSPHQWQGGVMPETEPLCCL